MEREEVAGRRVGGKDAGCEGVAPARVTALVTGAAVDVPATEPHAARARAGAQASTRMAAGRASRMGRDVSNSRVPEWHLRRSVRISLSR
jgi:hypothetical protein